MADLGSRGMVREAPDSRANSHGGTAWRSFLTTIASCPAAYSEKAALLRDHLWNVVVGFIDFDRFVARQL